MAGAIDRKKSGVATEAALYFAQRHVAAPAITQAGLLFAGRPPPSRSLLATQTPFLYAARPPAAFQERITQAALLMTVQDQGSNKVRVPQAALLIATKTGVPGQTRQRAWTFDFDGHSFYVLDLAQEGTWLYDMTTQEWTKFDTPGYGVWNMLNGYAWESNQAVMGGDSIQPTVLKLDPTSHLDDGWRPVQYTVTGGMSTGTRDSKSIDTVRLNVSTGREVDPMPTITLRFSDDNASTWSKDYPFTLVQGKYNQVIEWNSLGQFSIPGRVFEFRDQGGLVRIDAASLQIQGQE